MKNNHNSYAHRSDRYKDRSNFGSDEYNDPASDADSVAPPTDISSSYVPYEDEYDPEYEEDQDAPYEDSFILYSKQSMQENDLEGYDPTDLLQHDEFGRTRHKAKTRKTRTAKRHERVKDVWGWVISIVLAVVAALLIRNYIFEIILVDGESMYPTLYTSERVAVEKITRYGGMPRRGDIIIVEYPDLTSAYVKRTIGLPGETVEIKDSTVYINGQPLAEDYISTDPYADMAAVIVPEDHVFVMGDNRAHSLDSRTEYIGPISHDAIIGHGLFVIWPLNSMHSIS